jgi:hypothetical protein
MTGPGVVPRFRVKDLFGVKTMPVTLLVAAVDALGSTRGRADFRCDGINDEVQIQSALDSLPPAGGRVLLSEGTFVCSKVGTRANPTQGYCININQNHPPVTLEGMGWSTIIQLADNQDANTTLVLARGDTGDLRTNSTYIGNFKADGNKTGQVAVWTDHATIECGYCYDVHFDKLWIIDPTIICIRPAFLTSERTKLTDSLIDATNGEVGIRSESTRIEITGNYIQASNDAGSGVGLGLATNADLDIPSQFVSIANNVMDGGLNQCDLSGARHCSFFGNRFINSTNNSGRSLVLSHYDAVIDYSVFENLIVANNFYNIRTAIQLSSGGNVNLSNYRNLISQNTIIDGPDVNLAFGIQEAGANADNNMILENIIQGAATPIVRAGANTVIRGNKGFATENSGTGTIASGTTSVVISHGLAVTPTIDDINVVLAENPTNDPGNIWVDTITATQFTVNCRNDPGASNLDFAWRAVAL